MAQIEIISMLTHLKVYADIAVMALLLVSTQAVELILNRRCKLVANYIRGGASNFGSIIQNAPDLTSVQVDIVGETLFVAL